MDNISGMEVVCRHADGFRGRILDKDTGVVLGEAQNEQPETNSHYGAFR